jgi:hypothetical protein
MDFDPASWHLAYVTGQILAGLWLALRMARRGRSDDGDSSFWLARAGAPLVVIAGVAQHVTTGAPG